MKRRHGLFATFLILTVTLACAMPAIAPASPSAPTPDTRLGTIVAETVSAALELTRQVQAIPTATNPPTPTAEPTATSTPEALDTSGSTLRTEENGNVIFTDERSGYRIEVPHAWLALRINQQEYLDAWLLPEASNTAVQNILGDMQTLDPDRFRLFALDINEEHIDGGFVTNVNVLRDDELEISLADETGLNAIAATYPESEPGVEVLPVEIVALENGVTVGIIATRLPATTLDDVEIVVVRKRVFIDLPVGTLVITLSTTETWQETAEPLFDTMIESLTIGLE